MVRVTPIPLSYNTAYLIEDADERLLVDTGPDYAGATGVLETALAGREPSLVMATHGHLDHAGLGRWWQSRGATVAVARDDEHLVRRPHFAVAGEFEAFDVFVKASGAPPDVQAEVMRGLARRRDWVAQASVLPGHPPPRPGDRWPTGLRFETFAPDRLLDDGDAPTRDTAAIHCPGHTPGNLVLVHQRGEFLFSGDQLLHDITPTPGVQFIQGEGGMWRRFPSLPPFVASLERLAALHFSRCYPGHGEPFDNVAEVISANLSQVEQRTERVCSALRDSDATLHGLAERLYPRALGRRWWQIVATVQGHLDLLDARNEALAEDGVWRAT